MASTLHYLTVQDILWVNLQATKKVHHFNYARLEEATFYQYAYGESNTLLPQAARFLSGFQRMHPFETGNEVTGFLSFVAFLRVNGHDLDLADEDGPEWFAGILSRKVNVRDAIASRVVAHDHHGHASPDVRAAITEVLRDYPCTVLQLLAVPAGA